MHVFGLSFDLLPKLHWAHYSQPYVHRQQEMQLLPANAPTFTQTLGLAVCSITCTRIGSSRQCSSLLVDASLQRGSAQS